MTQQLTNLIEEATRIFQICNACRYCEGYCAVFPAIERRLEFTPDDAHYLANLCHNCGACLYACQYSPPHEFNLNFPQVMAQVRAQTYKRYAWPQALAKAYDHNGLVTSVVTMLSLAAVFAFTSWYASPDRFFAAWSDAQGSFYALLPHDLMVVTFGGVSVFVMIAFLMGFARFWPDMGEDTLEFLKAPSFSAAVWDAAGLRYMDGGGLGCTYPTDRPSNARRVFHHFTFYGFVLCFAATSVATIYHYVFSWKAPYPIYSLPVLLGIVGGIGLLIGPVGLLWLRSRRDPALADANQNGMDLGFLALLFMVSLTGLALLFLRETRAMGLTLALHLGAVLALFLMLPYGKFVHALYRFAALVRFHIERKRPLPEVGSE